MCQEVHFYLIWEAVLTPLVIEFKKAVLRLEEAVNYKKDDFLRDSVIQRFKFCVELAWKSSKKIMGTVSSAPKDVIREMAQSGYIQDVDKWLHAVDMRNLSSHTYKEDLAEEVYAFACNFLGELKNVVSRLEKK